MQNLVNDASIAELTKRKSTDDKVRLFIFYYFLCLRFLGAVKKFLSTS